MEDPRHFPFVIVGGGIAGVCCAEMMSTLAPEEKVLLLSASPVVKAVTNFRKVTRRLEDFDVIEKPMFEFNAQCPNVTVVQDTVSDLNVQEKKITTASSKTYTYSRLCLCSGGTPKLITEDNLCVLGIRDTETVKVFQQRLENARRILVVGNGGIATEIVYEIEGCEVMWAIKDESITSTFIDSAAAAFFLPHLEQDKEPNTGPVKRTKYSIKEGNTQSSGAASSSVTSQDGMGDDVTRGSALGPDWHADVQLHGARHDTSHKIHIEYKTEVSELLTPAQLSSSSHTPDAFPNSSFAEDSWPVYVRLTSGKLFGCDFVVSATGVIPSTQPFCKHQQFKMSEDGGICVNEAMLTSQPEVYAAGDVCFAEWEWAPFWQQMRLWSQARQMGAYAAKCMLAHSQDTQVHQDFCFELFAHVTKFFNFKVVLLGKYNAQGLDPSEYDLLVRVTKGQEYVKAVMQNGRMIGAILIGDTDLEETFENLILNQMDLSRFGADLLDPNIDIEDYFD